MSKKIVIIGALGYLGTELCKLYSGESWFNKIVAIDSRFASARVSQLKDWNIEFRQGHILDVEFLKRNLNDADLILVKSIKIMPKKIIIIGALGY